jgi:chemotaxis protein methyltransferase CheR
MSADVARALAEVRVLGRSPLAAYLRVNEAVWRRLPRWMTDLRPVTSYGRLLHALVLAHGHRRMYLGTFFFRNRPELELIRRLSAQRSAEKGQVRLAVVGCSNGAEVYSIAWAVRSTDAALNLVVNAVDISADAVEAGRQGVYSLGVSSFVQEPIFERTTPEEMQQMFDADRDVARVRPWLKEGISWHVGDAGDRRLAQALGPHDIVVANRFLCHKEPAEAEALLREIARWVAPGGYLFVSGVDLDVRARVAKSLGWKPVIDSLREIHEGDPSVRLSWPTKYWGLEPLDTGRPDCLLRYAAAFQLG